jgi:DNA-binding winged helix-turn-helix (wHTH) protein/Flp pilus assembly protein TadD
MPADDRLHLFATFTLDRARGCLLSDGEVVHLRPQAYRLLAYLAEQRGRLVSKDELIHHVWQGRAVGDDSLVQCLRDVRHALGSEGPARIRTVRGRGYIFEDAETANVPAPPAATGDAAAGAPPFRRRAWLIVPAGLAIAAAAFAMADRTEAPGESAEGTTPAAASYTPDTDAELLYRRGRHRQTEVTEAGLRGAIDLYTRALTAQPDHGRSLAGLAEAHRALAVIGAARSSDAFPLARQAASRALALDDRLVEAHLAMAWIGFSYDWDWEGAERSFTRALELEPQNADVHRGYAHLLSNLGRHDEATYVMARARELNPRSGLIRSLEAQFLFYAGRYDECERRIRELIEEDPDAWLPYLQLGRLRILRGQLPDAIEALEKAVRLSDRTVEPLTQLGFAYAAAGQADRARTVIDELERRAATAPVPSYSFAMICNGLREREAALAHLERAVDERELQVTFLRVDTRWNWLRTDPRFDALVRRVNLN